MTAKNNAAAQGAENMENEKVLEFRVATLEREHGETLAAIKSIDNSLKTLTALEVHHSQTREALGRAFTDIEDHETRLRKVETEMPTMKLVRNWVIAGVIGCVSMVGVAVAGLVIVAAKPAPTEIQHQVQR